MSDYNVDSDNNSSRKLSTTDSTMDLVITNTSDIESIQQDVSNHICSHSSIPSHNRWEQIDLGLIQTIFSLWFKNVSQRVSVTLSIISTIIFSLLDNFSDFYVAYTLFYKEEWTYGCIVIICDYIPGWQLAIHNVYFKSWKKWIRANQQIITLVFLLVSPLSLPLFFLQWLILFDSTDQNTFNYLHHNARLSQLLNGSVESPLQIVILFILWGEGKLDTPWTRSTVLSDSIGNELDLGALPGMLSLVMSAIVILKGSLEVVESTNWREKFVVCGYALSNFIFRLSSFVLSLMYFREWSALLFGTIFIINVTTIIRYDSGKRKRISVITSAIISMFTPFVSSEEPHLFQWKNSNLKHHNIEYSRHRRNLSSRIAVYTFPPILTSNLALFCLLKYYPSYKYDQNIVLEKETTESILCLLLPIAASALLSAITFQKRQVHFFMKRNTSGMNFFRVDDICQFYGRSILESKENIVHYLRYFGRILSVVLILTSFIYGIIHFRWFESMPTITPPLACFDIKTITSNGGNENSWTLGSCSSNKTYDNHNQYEEECCLPYGKYELSCNDSNGDGWEGGYIQINGTSYCNVLKQFKTRKEAISIGMF